MSDEAFDRAAKEVFDQVMERHPSYATYLGIHTYDNLLGHTSRAFMEEELALTREWRDRFAAFDPDTLSGGRPLDRDLALYVMDLDLFQLAEVRHWESIPGAAEGVGEALFALFTREFAPLEERMGSITGRMEEVPRYLDEVRTRISRPVRLWTETELEASQGTPMFLEVIHRAADGQISGDAFKALTKAKKGAQDALEAYRTWLKEEILPGASEEHILGEEHLTKWVALRKLGYDADEIRALGVRYFEESKKALAEVAKGIDPEASVEEVKERVKGEHPKTFDAVLEAVRDAVREAREFVTKNRLATLPPAEKLHVVETPAFIRPVIPFAALFGAAKFDAVQEGVYIVTPPSNGDELLKEHSYPGIINTAVHEGYPGHHLQLAAANLHPSLLRTFGGAVETVEGWAHYCEDMMYEAGFHASPELRVIQLLDVIWRACRIIIDVDLHRGKMTFDEAVEMLVREAGMEKPSALAEVKRYTQYPTYQLSYLLGKHLIKELRAEVEERMGDRFSLGFFHDTILYAGSVPFFLLRRAMEDKLAKLEEDVEDLR